MMKEYPALGVRTYELNMFPKERDSFTETMRLGYKDL